MEWSARLRRRRCLQCYGQSINGRPGWRLPTVEEMLNLLDYKVFGPDDSRLPLGHPFQNVLTGVVNYYWTSSVDPGDPTKAYGVTVNANVSAPASFAKSDNRGIWCVRGGSQ
ncbi:MAG TPA: DUF1566 domain-containing protein [bacterium]|nr:DUF1566 domain-containing protein [bacterium]